MAYIETPQRRRKTISADLFRTIMNRFLKKKGTAEAPAANDEALQAFMASAPPPPSSQPTSPGLKKSGTRRWMRRKEQPEPKPELNITAALPSSDDFRTSLLMPNLSARFSMLREQDDPRSLLGKASDDSVLQPRRRSRMNDLAFGSTNLGDIAEVSSIKGSTSSIRPPFASSRQDSFGSEAGGSEDGGDGSIMSRARRGEGNTMFGGRQKVYMIGGGAAASTKSLGKMAYDDDIKMSAFQKYRRQRELEEGRVSDESSGFDFGLDQTGAGDQDDRHAITPNDSAKDLSHSPSLSSYDRKRSTASTSHSEARSSTAATSVTSQPVTSNPTPAAMPTQPPAPVPAMPLKRADTKARRLYEQGLDQHMQEQQTSALSRLNSIQRQRTLNGGKQGPPYLHGAKSASNLQESARQPVYAVRSQSPTPVSPLPALTTFSSVGMSSPNLSGPQSPTSPQAGHFDDDQFLNSTLDPADRGKATAMGHFDKPKQAFNEQQYLERTRQLQRANSNAATRKEVPSTSAFQQRMGRFEQDRQRSDSQASTRSRSRSAPKKSEPTKAYNVFQRAAGQIQAQPGAQTFDKSNLPDTHRTFFGDISASDSEDEDEQQSQQAPPRNFMPQYHQPDYGYGSHGRWQPTPLPSVSEHPALRGQRSKASLAEEDELEPAPLRDPPSSRSLKTDTETIKAGPSEQDFDSPTIPTNVQPLNGMMQHLRQRSNQSSIFPGDEMPPADRDVPEMPQWNAQSFDLDNRNTRNTVDSESRIASTYTSSNPWDLEETDSRMSRASISPIEEPRSRDMFSGRAPSRQTGRGRESEVVSPLPADDGPSPQPVPEAPWQNELTHGHTRDASTATQQERDAFASELAARRTAIQESMKNRAESQSRGTSPAPSATGARKALGILKSRPSRESMDTARPAPQGPPKAMKMLGLSGQSGNASSNTLNSQYERSASSFDVNRSRDNFMASPPPIPMPTQPPRQFEAQRDRELSRSRGDSGASAHGREPIHPTGRSPASSQGGRSRANSEATRGGRSRSRTGPYRDDLDKAMAEGTGSSAAALPDLSPMIPRELTPRPSPEIGSGSFEANRPRTNSRAGMSNYFEQKNIQPIHPAFQKERLQAAGPSPISLSSNVLTPAGSSARPSPTSPFVQNMTPPMSGSNTPTFTPPLMHSPPVQPSQVIPPNRTGPLRKKTVSKADISEPTLVSYTSNIDTIELPEGASLKNGMDEIAPPPVPPINPRRRAAHRMFSIGRKDSEESQNMNVNRSKTPDPWTSKAPEPDFPFDVARANRNRSNSRSPGPQQALSSPPMHEYGFNQPTTGSPERVERSPAPPHPVAMEGGMF